MDSLTAFGLFAVTAMLVCYAMEQRSAWWILGFAAACALGSAYGFLQGAWPFGVIEAIWAGVAIRRWRIRTVVGDRGERRALRYSRRQLLANAAIAASRVAA